MEEVWLEQAAPRHRANTGIFIPFVIVRLQEPGMENQAVLTVVLRDIARNGDVEHTLLVRWQPESVPTMPLGVDSKTITEWAACGIASLVSIVYTNLAIHSTAEQGDRFDYWAWDGEQNYGLEVSGTISEDPNELETRHREKTRQLLENPHGLSGFVSVTSFPLRRTLFSLQRFRVE
jgi:hypothetical protein